MDLILTHEGSDTIPTNMIRTEVDWDARKNSLDGFNFCRCAVNNEAFWLPIWLDFSGTLFDSLKELFDLFCSFGLLDAPCNWKTHKMSVECHQGEKRKLERQWKLLSEFW